jgi:hypothetical protein
VCSSKGVVGSSVVERWEASGWAKADEAMRSKIPTVRFVGFRGGFSGSRSAGGNLEAFVRGFAHKTCKAVSILLKRAPMDSYSIKSRRGLRTIAVVALMAFLPVLQGFHAHPVSGVDDPRSLIEQPVDVAEFSTECLFCAVGSLKFSGPESGLRVDLGHGPGVLFTGPFQPLAFAHSMQTGGPRSPPRSI